jgi:tetratricopeptide (TPR) repeat protein
MAGEHGKALEAARRAQEIDSESYLVRLILQSVLFLNGQFEESAIAGESALAISGRLSWSLVTLAGALVESGKTADADAIYAEMLARARRQYIPPAHLAWLAAALSKEDEAINHSRQAFAISDPFCRTFFSKHFPPWARLYVYSRFRQLVSEVGFQ